MPHSTNLWNRLKYDSFWHNPPPTSSASRRPSFSHPHFDRPAFFPRSSSPCTLITRIALGHFVNLLDKDCPFFTVSLSFSIIKS